MLLAQLGSLACYLACRLLRGRVVIERRRGRKSHNLKIASSLYYYLGDGVQMKMLLFLFLLLPSFVFAIETEVKGQVIAVTVFSDRAEVKRETAVKFLKGGGRIVVRGIPQGIEASSVKVGGSAAGVSVSSVEVRQSYRAGLSDPQTELLKSQLEAAEQKLASLRRKVERLERLQNMLVSMSGKGDIDGKARTAADTKELLNLIVSYGDSFSASFDETSKAAKVAEQQVSLLQEQLSTISRERRGESVVVVDYDAAQEKDGNLRISYQVYGASWQPEYRLQVPVEGDKYEFDVYGLVSQQSGEDWNGANLILSTAMPQVGLARPEVPAWYVDVERPVQTYAKRTLAASEMDMAGGVQALRNIDESEGAAPSEPIEQQVARIVRHGAVTFNVDTPATIKSDGALHKVKLASWQLTGHTRLVAVPAESKHAFREVNLKNSLEVPLLPGNVHVFGGEQFLGTHSIPYLTMGKELVIPAGVFEGISVERIQKRRYEDDSGLIRSVRRIRSEYEIRLLNSTAVPLKLSVLEAAPVSRNEKIKAVIVESQPQAMEAGDPLRVTKGEGILEWSLDLASGAESKIKLAHEIEFESSVKVTGLEEWR